MRQRLQPKWNKLRFPEIMYGVPKPEPVVAYSDKKKWRQYGNKKVVLKGTAVCPGDSLARACVVTDLKDADQIKAGKLFLFTMELMKVMVFDVQA